MKRGLLYILIGILFFSCARVGSPVGGPKDSIPPVFLNANIDTTRINVSRNIKQLRLDFDEYVQLKEVNKNLIISPPIKNITKILPTSLATKFVLIEWEDELLENTTYNFNFGNSIQDNNEGNALPYFNFAFSTGSVIDQLYISGEVTDGFRITKEANSVGKNVVGLYQDSDSLDYRQKPYYITKADEDGYFELNYLSPGKYRILAFEDENGNSVFDEGKEKVAFQKESILLEKSISGLPLKIFPSKKKVKSKELTEMNGGILMTFEGNPEKVEVRAVSEKLKDFKVSHQKYSDSVRVYFDAAAQNIGIAQTEKVELAYNADGKQDSVSVFYKNNAKNELIVSNEATNLLAPFSDLKLTSNQVLNKIMPETWTLKRDSTLVIPFTARISDKNPFEIFVKADFVEGESYQLTVPKGSISSFYEATAVSKRYDFQADKIQNYGSLQLKLINKPANKFWVQLLNTSENVQYSVYTDASDIKFNILKPGEYFVKILSDENGNEFYDAADFTALQQAEPVYIFYKKINVRPLWEIVEDWDLKDERKLDPAATTISKPQTPANTEDRPVRPLNNKAVQGNGASLTPLR